MLLVMLIGLKTKSQQGINTNSKNVFSPNVNSLYIKVHCLGAPPYWFPTQKRQHGNKAKPSHKDEAFFYAY